MIKRINILVLLAVICVMISACIPDDRVSDTAASVETIELIPTEIVDETPDKYEDINEETMITVTDMAQRQVTIPSVINKTFGVNNTSSILLYTLVPNKLIGWNISFSDEAKLFMTPECANLPVFGNLYGNGKKAEIEEIIAQSPDVIVLTDQKLSDKLKKAANELQARSGIPVLIVVANINTYGAAYQFLGDVFNEEPRAEQLSNYAKTTIDDIKTLSLTIDEADKKWVYYARGDDGLTTEFSGSPNTQVLELVGGINIAINDGVGVSGTVSMEQIIKWNPDTILVGNIGAAKTGAQKEILGNGLWNDIDAVIYENVMGTPSYPFNWFDRPPSVNRLIGLKWLGQTLYPDIYNYDLAQEIVEFFSLFYGVEITNDQALELMLE